jgi:uncharacterized membrane protein
MGGAGLMHFVRPTFFDVIVPRWMPGRPRTITYVSGAFELAAAALVLNPRTRRLGGWWSVATLVGVYPANVQMAIDGGIEGADPPLDSAAMSWLRLPLQFPMIWRAVRVARGR